MSQNRENHFNSVRKNQSEVNPPKVKCSAKHALCKCSLGEGFGMENKPIAGSGGNSWLEKHNALNDCVL